MGKPRHAVEAWSQYLAARLASMALDTFDIETTLGVAATLGRAMHRVDRKHRERCAKHLRIAFPEYDDAKIEQLTLEAFEHLVQLVVEVSATPRLIHADSWAGRLRLGNMGPGIGLLNAEKPLLMVTGHLGNWEVLGFLMAVLGYRTDALARPIDNPLINDWLLGIRQRRGMRIITKWNATERMLSVLDAGGALGFIADQNAGDKGLFVPFFGKLASTYKSIGLLAISRDVPVVCGYARRVGSGYDYEVGIADAIMPHEWAEQPDPLYYVSARYMRAIELMVRQCPHQYLWMHRRWKSRPRHERQGKPLPGGMQRKLESLPWMTQPLLEQLKQPLPA